MGWFDTVLNVADVAVALSSRRKLSDLVEQGASQQSIQEVFNTLKNIIFRFKEIAEAILENEQHSPRMTSIALKLLDHSLDESGVLPDMFPDFSEKEYVSGVIKLIKTNNIRLFENRTNEEKTEIIDSYNTLMRMGNIQNYVNNYDLYKKYLGVNDQQNKAFDISGLALSSTSAQPWEDNPTEIIAKAESELDLESMKKIDIEFDGNKNKAQSELDRAVEIQHNLEAQIPSLKRLS